MVVSSSRLGAFDTIDSRPILSTSGNELQGGEQNTPSVERIESYNKHLHNPHPISTIASMPIAQYPWQNTSSLPDPRYEMGWGQPSLGHDVLATHDTEVCPSRSDYEVSLVNHTGVHSSTFSPLCLDATCPPPANVTSNWYHPGPQRVQTTPDLRTLDSTSKTDVGQASTFTQAQDVIWADPSK